MEPSTLIASLLAPLLMAGVMAGFAVGLPLLIWALVRHANRRDEAWRHVAQQMGAQGEVGHLTAAVDGLGVRLKETVEHSGKNATTYTDLLVSGPSEHIAILPQRMLSGLFHRVDHEVGDPTVDDRYVLQGHPLALGLLDPQTRHLLRHTGIELTVREGVLRLRRLGTMHDGEALENLVAWGVALARGLMAEPDELVGRLMEGVRSDPEVEVRRRFLEILQEHAPDHAREAARWVLQDTEPALTVLAAWILQDTERLVALVADRHAATDIRIEAMGALGGTEALARGVSVALSDPGAPRLWRAAAMAAQQGGGPEVVGALAAISPLMVETSWPAGREARARRVAVAREVAVALGRLPPDPASEALLLQLLRHEDSATRAASVEALGQVGSVAAVAPLQEAGSGLLSWLGDGVRDAVRSIQARSGGARGGLAIVERSSGDLSMADDPARRAQAAARRTEGPQRH